MTTLKLPPLMDDCPRYWQNFGRTFDCWDTMVIELKKHNAWPAGGLRMRSGELVDSNDLRVKFKTPEDLTFFIMKWS